VSAAGLFLLTCGLASTSAQQQRAKRADRKTVVDKVDRKVDRKADTSAALIPKFVNKGSRFQLICRGGQGLLITTSDSRPDPQGRGFPPYAYAPITTMRVSFQRSTQPPTGSGRNLQPGQCSPADFPLQEADPAQIQVWGVTTDGQWRRERDGIPYDKSPEVAERYPDSQNTTEYLKNPRNYWSFFVTDKGEGYFEGSESRYWKPEFYKGIPVRPFAEEIKTLPLSKPPR
ncbi:MAG: hypothetical protein ACJ741_10125, partial [Pyrinomonadaceae bacterium]